MIEFQYVGKLASAGFAEECPPDEQQAEQLDGVHDDNF